MDSFTELIFQNEKKTIQQMHFLFWLHESKVPETAIVYARITIDGKRAEFSTGVTINPKHWGGAKLITHKTQKAIEQNDRLRQLEADAFRVYNRLRDENEFISAVILKEKILNKKVQLTFNQLVKDYLDSRFAQVGISCKPLTAKKHERYASRILAYAEAEKINLPADFNSQKALQFATYLKQNHNYVNAYINKHFDCLRSIFRFAQRMQIAPYTLSCLKDLPEKEPEVVYLEAEEQAAIENLEIENFTKLSKVRDILLMCIETGLHYIDYTQLARNAKIETDADGDQWILLHRIKTEKPVDILLSEKAKNIIEKYGGLHCLPAISNQKCNDYLKVIALMANIDKNITTKIGRKTFCDTMINQRRVRLDIVATTLGLTSVRNLKHYGNPRRALIKAELQNK